MENGRIDNDKARRIFKILEDMEGSENDYSNLTYRSGDNMYFNFAWFEPLSSFYFTLINSHIGTNLAKLNMKEFKDQIDWIVRKKAKKLTHKNLKDLFKNAKVLYNGMNVIMDAFQKRVFVTP